MKRFLLAVTLSVAALPHCTPYGPDLIDPGDGSTGGTAPASGGALTGGAATGGSAPLTGGSASGGGGGDVPIVATVDDLEQGPVYANGPFTGGWDRFIDTGVDGGTWAAASMAAMVQEDPADATNHAFHVEATAFGPTSWGLGVYVTLNQTTDVESIDISAYTKLKFRARGSTSTATVLRVSVEDEESHTKPCPAADCVAHASVGQRSLPADTWQDVEFNLAPNRTPAFDPTKAYAIHFTMDPPSTETVID
ncbi:MAG TPA: hypothetical protein VLC09_17130, partial [Polyangiaceae bacterium]|nr:hypothetical protein [Polyangiaceae bacterium]